VAFDPISVVVDLLINIVFWVIAVVPTLWISGRLLVGKQNAKFTDALWIVIFGVVIFYFIRFFIDAAAIFSSLIGTLIAYFLLLIIWLALVKHFFDCSWLKAFLISIIAIIIAVVVWLIIGFLLVLIGASTGFFPDPTQLFNI
jgi:hypothetical protein